MKAFGLSNAPVRSGVNTPFGQYSEVVPGPFTLTGGTGGLVTIANNVIQCAAHNGPISSYRKFFSSTQTLTPLRASFASLDFQVTANNPDDAPTIFIADLFSLQPRREAAIDVNRRCVIGFNATLQTVGTVGVNIGTWYRLTLNINQQTGLANWIIEERDTKTLFQSGIVSSAALSSAFVNRIDLSFDTGGLTCPSNFARILIG